MEVTGLGWGRRAPWPKLAITTEGGWKKVAAADVLVLRHGGVEKQCSKKKRHVSLDEHRTAVIVARWISRRLGTYCGDRPL
jgi:hypothetical protein